jgi:hypothetical protein
MMLETHFIGLKIYELARLISESMLKHSESTLLAHICPPESVYMGRYCAGHKALGGNHIGTCNNILCKVVFEMV